MADKNITHTDVQDQPTQHVVVQPVAPAAVDDFDLDLPIALDEVELEIVHPKTKVGTGWIWYIAGPAHPVTLALQDKYGKKDRAQNFQERRAIQNGRDPKEQSNKEITDDVAVRYAGRVLRWNRSQKINGELFEYSHQTVLKLLSDPRYFYFFPQIIKFFSEDENFLPSSKRS